MYLKNLLSMMKYTTYAVHIKLDAKVRVVYFTIDNAKRQKDDNSVTSCFKTMSNALSA